MTQKILIIDDDVQLCQLLRDFLELESFELSAIHDGLEAVEHCKQNSYEAIVLDIMLPGLQGLEVLRELRKFSSTPVIMLTAKGEDTDRILGLELGADDYLPKPCNPKELAARLRAVLRRAQQQSLPANQPLQLGETTLYRSERRATYRDQTLPLTSIEFNVFQALLEGAGNVVDKDSLSRQALNRPLSSYDRSIDVHISKIRKKLALAGAPELIVSVRGIGYQFTCKSS